jgi:hypothetical protein
MEQRGPISLLKTLNGRTLPFQKLMPFSQGNNVSNAPASNPDGVLSRDTSVSSTQLKRPFWKKGILSPR